MFKLTQQLAKLSNINHRIEKHGEKSVAGCDLKIEITAANDALDVFNPALRTFLFRPADQPGDQPGLDLEHKPLTALNVPHLAPLVLDEKWPGYTVSVKTSLGKQKPIVLDACELARFRFEAIEGGSVKITFSVACRPTGPEIGKLSDLAVDGEIELTLEPPRAEAQQALDAVGEREEVEG